MLIVGGVRTKKLARVLERMGRDRPALERFPEYQVDTRRIVFEARYFTQLATSDQCKDMVRTLWYHRTAAEKQKDLPALAEGQDAGINKVAILGAGMMGAGLGWVCAKAGYDVVIAGA